MSDVLPLGPELSAEYDRIFDGYYWLGKPMYEALDAESDIGMPGRINRIGQDPLMRQLFGRKSQVGLRPVAEYGDDARFIASRHDHLSLVHSTFEAMTRHIHPDELRESESEDFYEYFDNGYQVTRQVYGKKAAEYFLGSAWHMVWHQNDIPVAEPINIFGNPEDTGVLTPTDVLIHGPIREDLSVRNAGEFSYAAWRVNGTTRHKPETLRAAKPWQIQHQRFHKTVVYRVDRKHRPTSSKPKDERGKAPHLKLRPGLGF